MHLCWVDCKTNRIGSLHKVTYARARLEPEKAPGIPCSQTQSHTVHRHLLKIPPDNAHRSCFPSCRLSSEDRLIARMPWEASPPARKDQSGSSSRAGVEMGKTVDACELALGRRLIDGTYHRCHVAGSDPSVLPCFSILVPSMGGASIACCGKDMPNTGLPSWPYPLAGYLV